MKNSLKLFVILANVLAFTATAQAQEKTIMVEAETPVLAAASAAQSHHQVLIKVNGLVCDFCARALEKVFSKRDEVANIAVDLSKAEVRVTMKPNQTLDDATLTSLITDSGYNVTQIIRH